MFLNGISFTLLDNNWCVIRFTSIRFSKSYKTRVTEKLFVRQKRVDLSIWTSMELKTNIKKGKSFKKHTTTPQISPLSNRAIAQSKDFIMALFRRCVMSLFRSIDRPRSWEKRRLLNEIADNRLGTTSRFNHTIISPTPPPPASPLPKEKKEWTASKFWQCIDCGESIGSARTMRKLT